MCGISGPTPDLQVQHLHFNGIPGYLGARDSLRSPGGLKCKPDHAPAPLPAKTSSEAATAQALCLTLNAFSDPMSIDLSAWHPSSSPCAPILQPQRTFMAPQPHPLHLCSGCWFLYASRWLTSRGSSTSTSMKPILLNLPKVISQCVLIPTRMCVDLQGNLKRLLPLPTNCNLF